MKKLKTFVLVALLFIATLLSTTNDAFAQTTTTNTGSYVTNDQRTGQFSVPANLEGGVPFTNKTNQEVKVTISTEGTWSLGSGFPAVDANGFDSSYLGETAKGLKYPGKAASSLLAVNSANNQPIQVGRQTTITLAPGATFTFLNNDLVQPISFYNDNKDSIIVKWSTPPAIELGNNVIPVTPPAPKGGEIAGSKWNDLNGDGINNSEPALAGIQIYLDLNNNGVLDAGEPTQVTKENGEYRFTALNPGTYIVREVVPSSFKQTYPIKLTKPGDGYADTVLEFYNSGTGPIPGPYGSKGGIPNPLVQGKYTIQPVSPNVVLGSPPPSPIIGRNPQVDWLALPRGSYVTVGFTDERIVDGPGDDIFIRSFDPQDSANENADIFVSANGTDFKLLGRVNEKGRVALDLASIKFTEPVKAVRVVGVDELGSSPGFDLIGVEALPKSISAADFHTVTLNQGQVVDNINFGNNKS